jgi:hypothetical protein
MAKFFQIAIIIYKSFSKLALNQNTMKICMPNSIIILTECPKSVKFFAFGTISPPQTGTVLSLTKTQNSKISDNGQRKTGLSSVKLHVQQQTRSLFPSAEVHK